MEKPHRSVRQMIEGMTLTFNPKEAEGVEAVIQFNITDPDGIYHLRIEGRECTFHPGPAENPALTILTPAKVWQQISREEISGREALEKGLYRVEGDLDLLVNFSRLFDGRQSEIRAPGQRPPGPIHLSGMAWLQAAFVPFILFWVFFEGDKIQLGLLLPFILALALVLYRLVYDRPTYFEWGTLFFFIVAGLFTLARIPWFLDWGLIVSSLFMGALWFGSVLFRKMPLCGDYSKWGYVEPLWRTSLFIHPNAVISLAWGWQFLIAALLGAIAMESEGFGLLLTVIRYLLLVPAMIFTIVYQKGADKRYIEDMERSLARIRLWSGLGLAVAGLMVAVTWFLPVR